MIECTVKTFCSFSESFYYYRYTLFNFLFHGLSLSIQKKKKLNVQNSIYENYYIVIRQLKYWRETGNYLYWLFMDCKMKYSCLIDGA